MAAKLVFSIVLLFSALIGLNPVVAAENNKNVAQGAELVKKYKCLSCHERASKRNYPPIPYLYGQHQRYLVKQLQAFRKDQPSSSGGFKISERYSHSMDVPAANLTNEEINHLATYFASRRCQSAERDVSKIAAPKLTSGCAFCHGEQGRSPFIAYPKIAGQNMGYLIQQLKLMRAAAKNPGEKAARFHRTMAAQVVALTDAEIVALGYYYSKQNCE